MTRNQECLGFQHDRRSVGMHTLQEGIGSALCLSTELARSDIVWSSFIDE